jgi:DNA-binding beta-propeller fold protein YncE
MDPIGSRTRTRSVNRRALLVSAAAGALGLAIDPLSIAARMKGSAVALVTADLESHVAVVDLVSARVFRRIETAPGPRAIEYIATRGPRLAGSGVVVAHTEHGVVTVIGAPSYSVRAELDGFSKPRYACSAPFSPHGAIAYVTDSAANELVAIDVLGSGRVVHRTRLPGPARHVSISPDGRTIWTALGSKAARIAVLDVSDPLRPRLERTFEPPFLAHDVVFAPLGKHVWVTSGAGNQIGLYRADTREVVRVVAADRAPQHVAFVGEFAFVSSGDDGTVRIHRLNGDLARVAEVPTGSYNVTFGGERVVTPSLSRGTVALLDERGAVRAVRTVARAAHDACVVSST